MAVGKWVLLGAVALLGIAAQGQTGTEKGSLEAMAANWPVFRGWGGNGRVMGNYAKTWDVKKGENVLWNVPTELSTNSSPVVWGDKVFITGGDDQTHNLYCYNAADGKLLWTGNVPRQLEEKIDMPDEAPETPPDPGQPEEEYHPTGSGYASATPAVDGTNVYVIYASGDIAAFDFSGKKVWQKFIDKPDSTYGYASSLTVVNGNVIVQWDMGENEKASKSSLIAYEGATGKEVWRTKRPGGNSWGSPVVTVDGKWIVTSGSPWASAYDAATGAETWRAHWLDADVTCTPCVVGGAALIANDHGVMALVKVDSKGDVTDKTIWKGEEGGDGLPDVVAATSDGKLIWTITANATLFCMDAKTGEKVYEEELKNSVLASPVLVGDELWITNERGVTRFIGTGREYKERGRANIGESVRASPAFAGGKMFVRTAKHLICIGAK